ncbi:N-acetylmuramoyl-L-alanine amidase [Escherichia phage Ebrios]|uniref:Endolysin n=1 Tax=Escherichia phage Ebrios TaxID=2099356 RepID=A0A2P1CL13_9CAUD|nr:amidase [Escherichia phage Ebrios]AVJ51900.1 N-acetylmuramoyl-L-alanine amidase [Escherichia phage Ebrios]
MSRVQFKQREATNAIFVHCSATKATQDVGVREIRQWHKEQGWLDVGYHFIIRRDGTVEDGRDVNAVGSHARGHNHNSVGVCLVGGIDEKGRHEANFTPQQMSSLRTLLEVLMDKYPSAVLKAHHDVAPKACPSFDLQRWWKHNELVTSDRG